MIKMMTIIGPLCGLLLGALVTWAMPRVYQSEIVITVIAPNFNLGPNAPISTCVTCDAANFEKITSPTTLRKVAAMLDLSSRWHVAEGEAVRMLLGMVTWRDNPKTHQMSIGVRDTDRVEARTIAAEVARVYLECRLETVERHYQLVLREMEQAIDDQQRVVEQRRKNLDSIKRVLDRNRGPTNNDYLLHLKYSTDDYIDAKRDIEFETDRLQAMMGKQHSEQSLKESPDKSVVEMGPTISDSPVSPNVPLNLTLGAVSGLLLAPLMSWRSKRARTERITRLRTHIPPQSDAAPSDGDKSPK